MARYLLLCSIALVFILTGSAALAEPVATEPPLFAVEQTEPAPAPLCLADLNMPKPMPMAVPICAGNGCDKTSDCRPANLPECAQCWCLGPAGDKSCSCF